MYVCMCFRGYIYIHTLHTYIHAYIHTYIHTYNRYRAGAEASTRTGGKESDSGMGFVAGNEEVD